MILACKQALSCGVGVWREEERELSLSSSLHPPTPHERANARRLASSFQEWQGKDFAKGYKWVIFAFWSKSYMRYDRKCSIWRHHMELPEGCIFSLKIHTNEFHVTSKQWNFFCWDYPWYIHIVFVLCFSCYLQALNPVFILVMIPIFETVIYPVLRKCNLLVR